MIEVEYQYPMDMDWNKQEIIDVIGFFHCIEKAYEKGIDREILIAAYRRFKEIVPSKSEEKKFFREFEEVSGFSSYHVVKQAREAEENRKIKMNR